MNKIKQKFAKEYIDSKFPNYTQWIKKTNMSRFLDRNDNSNQKTYFDRVTRINNKNSFIAGFNKAIELLKLDK